MTENPTNENLPEDADDAASADDIPADLMALHLVLDTGDAAQTAVEAAALKGMGE